MPSTPVNCRATLGDFLGDSGDSHHGDVWATPPRGGDPRFRLRGCGLRRRRAGADLSGPADPATARDRVELINREAIKALAAPQVRKVVVDSGLLRAIGSTPEEFARYLEKDMAWQKDIIRRIGMQ